MNAKETHRVNLLEFLGNPENPFPNRSFIAVTVLGLSNSQSLYAVFSVAEIEEIEREGLELRRQKYAPLIAKADTALLKEAEEGNVPAIKLAYQRFEGWSEKHAIEVSNTVVKITRKRFDGTKAEDKEE